MKNERLLQVLTVAPIIIEIIAILFLPAQVPIHYSMSLQVTQYGSKYMLLIIGGIALLFGIFINLIYKAYRKTDSEKLVYRLGMLALMVFNIINILSLIGACLI